MKKIFFIVAMALCTFAVNAQTSEYEQDLMKLMEVNGSSENYDLVYDQLVAQFKMMKPDVPQDFWNSAKTEVFNKEIESLNKQLVPVYQKYFTQDEIKQLIEFYTSPLGKKLTSGTNKIAQESMQISQTWGMGLGTKLQTFIAKKGF